MEDDFEGRKDLRCRPGDLAKVVYSTNRLLVGRIVLVERWGKYGRWDVMLLGEPAFGFEFETGIPLIGHKTAFRDSSLRPLDGRLIASELIRSKPPVYGFSRDGFFE